MPPGMGLFGFLFVVMLVIIIGSFVFRAISGISRWSRNNQQPVLTVSATVVTKRTEVHHHTNNNNGNVVNSSSTSYFVTFQVQSGDRMEFKVHGRDFGLLAEGDVGNLTFQGSRYYQFDRVS